MKKLLFTLSLAASICVAAQSAYRFEPKWKVGENKMVSISEHQVSIKNGSKEEDTTTTRTARFQVTGETATDYKLQVTYDNAVMNIAASFYDKLGEELPAYKEIKLQYIVSKKTGKPDLVNWKEVQQYINKSFEQINTLVKAKVPEMAPMLKAAFTPLKDVFKSKENIESYVNEEIGYILFPYDKQFVQGDTLKKVQYTANPFNPSDTIAQTTYAWVSGTDAVNQRTFISCREELDLSKFKEMMLGIVKNMAKSFGASDSTMNNKTKELDDLRFDLTKTAVITFDNKSNWPSTIVKTAKVIVSMPRKGTDEKTVVTTLTIK